MIKIIDIRTEKEVLIESDKVKIEDILKALNLIEKLDLNI